MAHEYLFGSFLLITLLRLMLSAQRPETDCWVFAALLAGIASAIAWHSRRPDLRLTLTVRLLVFFVAMNIAFMQMRTAVPALSPHKVDALLRQIDRGLIGETPAILMQGWVTPWLTELMSACYQLFFPYLTVAVLIYATRATPVACSAFAGLFSLYAVGFMGYTLMPALGPHLAFAGEFRTTLDAGPVTAYNAHLVKQFSTGVDVFPSLHVAITSYLLLIDRRFTPLRFRILVLPCMGLWLSTFYLRYHYMIDVIAGFALAGFGYWMARTEEKQHVLCPEV